MAVPIHPDDTVATLQARVLPIEHETQIAMLEDFVADRVTELVRDEPLVQPEERSILRDAKRAARLLYPKG
ncbi:MAG: hypothetical protein U1A16_03555 [Patescibacteria group bacterium]|nr:hypothetical protein [Patescibacteria group bacterium]